MTPEQAELLETLGLLRTQKEVAVARADRAIYQAVQTAHSKGLSWRQIAGALGMAVSNAYTRYQNNS